MSLDLVLTWPKHCDYPLFREWLARNRMYLGHVTIGFTEHHLDEDWRWHVRRELDRIGGVIATDVPREDGRDWRDGAVNACLDLIPRGDRLDRVWFTEPDFLIWDDRRFWSETAGMGGFPLVGYRDDGVEGRWHPSCLIVRRTVVEETSRYFGNVPVDHFYAFCEEAERIAGAPVPLPLRGVSLAEGLGGRGDFTHIGGLSRNHQLQSAGAYAGVRRPQEHALYLETCLKRARCHPLWADSAMDFIRWVKNG